MSTMEKHLIITLSDQRGTWTKWLRNIASMLLCACGPIAVGIVADSTAMQWVGFIFSAFLIISIGRGKLRENTAYTIAEAHALLDQIEADQSAGKDGVA